MNTIPLHGCTPEPLMGYLKGLGVFRIVAEQADPACRAAWWDGSMVLFTSLTKDGLARFFTEHYRPSPFFSPWNGDSGFLTENGSSYATIEKLRGTENPRLAQLREAIDNIESMDALKTFGRLRTEAKVFEKKKKRKQASAAELERLKCLNKQIKVLKEAILFKIRSDFPNSSLGWFDACLQVGENGFSVSPALGSGGVDGRLEFSANFLANLLAVFDDPESLQLVHCSLFAEGLARLHATSIGQFSPGNVGGPNATQGFEGDSSINPWDYILLIEGTPLLAGAISRRCRNSQFGRAVFPFTVSSTAQDGCSLETKDSNTARGELWLPLWDRRVLFHEITQVFGEGRSDWIDGPSRTNVDFAKAIASYGTDYGIRSFSRHGFLQRNGLAFLATPLGRFEVRAQEHVHLLREADPWIGRFRRACGDNAPQRFHSALRRVDSAVFDYCRFGGAERFQEILISLGRAERELSVSAGKIGKDGSCPILQNMAGEWVAAADDGSREFEIAAALAGIRGAAGKMPGLRAHLEPVSFQKSRLQWAEGGASVVWKRGDLCANMAAVLERRLLDARRLGLDIFPVRSPRTARPQTVAAFIAGAVDDEKIENLLWGLLGCAVERRSSRANGGDESGLPTHPLPRCYPLLKAIFSGLDRHSSAPVFRDARNAQTFEKLKLVKPDPRILQLLRAARPGEATALSAQRLRNADLVPARIDWEKESVGGVATGRRLAASLLIPLCARDLVRLLDLVSRREAPVLEDSHS